MRYAQIRSMDISNGVGIGVSLFVQGCHFHCKGCFNPETWDFAGGKEWTSEIEEKFIELAGKPFVERISILGGEPLADENVETIFFLTVRLKAIYPEKQIWIYTGYRIEDIFAERHKNSSSDDRMAILAFADVLVDGQFEFDKQDVNHKQIAFAGSTNQRVIDVRKTLRKGKVELLSV